MTKLDAVAAFAEFEFDPRRHELRRAGRGVRLQERPYQILECLLERPDELVTREELRDRIWPPGFHVEYEKSLAVGVMKLREALGDSAVDPRFIATIPRLGYRFIAPVELRAAGAAHAVSTALVVEPAPPASREDRSTIEVDRGLLATLARRRPRNRVAWATALLTLLAVALTCSRATG